MLVSYSQQKLSYEIDVLPLCVCVRVCVRACMCKTERYVTTTVAYPWSVFWE